MGKWELAHICKISGRLVQVASIASLLFETSSRMLMVVGMVFAANKRRQIFQGWLS